MDKIKVMYKEPGYRKPGLFKGYVTIGEILDSFWICRKPDDRFALSGAPLRGKDFDRTLADFGLTEGSAVILQRYAKPRDLDMYLRI